MKKDTTVRGYKVFNPDFTCKGFQFEVGKTYTIDKPLKICNTGFHFCTKASHCFEYYAFDPKNIVCEVIAHGDVLTHDEDSKRCTNKLEILRRLTWHEVLEVANEGKNNTGRSNTGYSNTGYRNTGGWNTGDRNTGYRNTGDRNTGYRNTGGWNTGDRNTGYSNTGYSNTGYRNTGDRNTGYSNTGGWNTGDRNTGYSNTGDRNTGVFCTGEKTMRFFNKDSDWTEKDFLNSRAYSLLCQIDTKMWVYANSMTDAEKEKYPSYKTADGYLKDIPFKEAFKNAWGNWNADNRSAFTSLPNFDKQIFFDITRVEV